MRRLGQAVRYEVHEVVPGFHSADKNRRQLSVDPRSQDRRERARQNAKLFRIYLDNEMNVVVDDGEQEDESARDCRESMKRRPSGRLGKK